MATQKLYFTSEIFISVLSEIDYAPDELMTAMIWRSVKGEYVNEPTLVGAAFVNTIKEDGTMINDS